jgi:hypothetical protein
MALSRVEKERIADSRLKLQAVTRSLKSIDRKKVPDYDEIEECLEGAEKSLGGALLRQESDQRQR